MEKSDPLLTLLEAEPVEASHATRSRNRDHARHFLAYATAVTPRVASPMVIIGLDFTADSVPGPIV